MRIKRTGRRGRHQHARHQEQAGSEVEELAAQLAPPEEQGHPAGTQAGAGQPAGTIMVDTAALKLPEGFGERKSESRLEIGRVVVIVTLLMLLFTAFIAWQISLMPDERDEPQPVRVVGAADGG